MPSKFPCLGQKKLKYNATYPCPKGFLQSFIKLRSHNLDAPNPSSEDPWDPRSVPTTSHRSSGSMKPKKAQNPNSPGKEYADAAREIVLHYYKVRSMEML